MTGYGTGLLRLRLKEIFETKFLKQIDIFLNLISFHLILYAIRFKKPIFLCLLFLSKTKQIIYTSILNGTSMFQQSLNQWKAQQFGEKLLQM